MYHANFIKAKDLYGNPMREERSGNLTGYCRRNYIAKVRTRWVETNYGGLTHGSSVFDGLELLCLCCGDVTWTGPDDLVDEDQWEKRIQEALAAFEEPPLLPSKPPRRARKPKPKT